MSLAPLRIARPALIQWAIFGVSLLFLGFVLAANRQTERSRIEAQEQERLLSQTQVVQQALDNNLVALHTVLGLLSNDWAQGNVGKDFALLLETLSQAMPGVGSLLILDEKGICRAANRRDLLGRDFSERAYYQVPLKSPDRDVLYVSPPFQSVLGEHVIVLSRIIQSPGGRFAGVVAANLDPEFFASMLRSVLDAHDVQATITHGNGSLFLIVPERNGLAGTNLNRPGSLFRRHLDTGQEASVLQGVSLLSGREGAWALRTVQPPDAKTNAALVVAIGHSPEALLSDWRKGTLFQGGLFLLFAVAFGVILMLFQKRQQAFELERAQAAEAVAESERFMRTITDSIPGLVAYWNDELKCVYSNHAYLDWFGKTKEQMQGIHIRELLGEELYKKNEMFIQAALWGQTQHFERAIPKADGSVGYTLSHYVPNIFDGVVHGFFVLVSDVTKLKTIQTKLERRVQELDSLATTDPLTGIGNRRYFLEHVKNELIRSGRYGLPLTGLALDIDHFKHVNDTMGHDAGDEVLKAMSALMRDTLRNTDFIGRMGGEEFAAMLIQTGLDEAKVIAERLRIVIQDSVVETASGPIRYTVSIGLAATTGSGDTAEDILKRADLALYRAKETGRNRVRWHGDV